jgi:hypothetical protein
VYTQQSLIEWKFPDSNTCFETDFRVKIPGFSVLKKTRMWNKWFVPVILALTTTQCH